MKPEPFCYHRPSTRAEVDDLLAHAEGDRKLLAGGQSLIPILNMRLAAPGHLVDINALVDEPSLPVDLGASISVGPLVRQRAVEDSPLIARKLPVMAQIVAHVAHPAIRSRGTVIGSIAHADPAGELPALMVALDGETHARSAAGTRVIAARDLFVGHLETCLQPDEWVHEVRFPVQDGRGSAVEEFARRRGDYALCGVIAIAALAGSQLRLTLTYIGMGAVPCRIELPPMDADDVRAPALADAVRAAVHSTLEPDADIHASVRYRRFLAERLGLRAARRAAAEVDGA